MPPEKLKEIYKIIANWQMNFCAIGFLNINYSSCWIEHPSWYPNFDNATPYSLLNI